MEGKRKIVIYFTKEWKEEIHYSPPGIYIYFDCEKNHNGRGEGKMEGSGYNK